MCGSETLEMLVSSSSMNVAIVTVSAIAHRLRVGSALGAAETFGPTAALAGVTGAILMARLTFPDAASDRDLARAQRGSSRGGAAPPLRSCQSRSQGAEG